MTSRRLLKAAEAIRGVVSMAILTEVRDPRVKNVTVVGVEVLPDMKSAKIFVSIMGDEKEQKLCLAGLQHSAGFLQQKIADRIDTRYIPRLTFVMDKGVKNSLEISRILSEVLPPNPAARDDDETDSDDESIGPPPDADLEDSASDLADQDAAGDDAADDDSADDSPRRGSAS